MSLVLNAISSTAFSLTLSGNSGISPFLTMLLIGITQKISPESFNMSETMEKIMSSWAGLTVWSIMTVLEFVGKCVPVIDQMVDSVEVFVVPWISTLGSASSFGSFDTSDSENDVNGERFLSQTTSSNNKEKAVLRGRTLEASSSMAKGMRHFFQAILLLCGMALAISLHFLKMLIRLMGEGCLTQLITIGEALTVILGVCLSVFIRQFAIVIAAFLCLGAAHGAKKKYEKWNKEEEEEGVDKSHSGRLKRFFSHKYAEKKEALQQEDSYVEMDEEQPKKKHFWSK